MIRHARALSASLAVLALAVAMVEPPLRTALMALIGPPALFAPGPPATLVAAIAMAPVAVQAQEKGRQTVRAKTSPLQQYRAVLRHRVRGGLDTGTRFVSA